MSTHTHDHTRSHTPTWHTFIHTSTHVHTHVHTPTRAHTLTNSYTLPHTCSHRHTYVHTLTCVDTHPPHTSVRLDILRHRGVTTMTRTSRGCTLEASTVSSYDELKKRCPSPVYSKCSLRLQGDTRAPWGVGRRRRKSHEGCNRRRVSVWPLQYRKLKS